MSVKRIQIFVEVFGQGLNVGSWSSCLLRQRNTNYL